MEHQFFYLHSTFGKSLEITHKHVNLGYVLHSNTYIADNLFGPSPVIALWSSAK